MTVGGGRVGQLQAITDAALSTLELDPLLDEIVARIPQILGVDSCAIVVRADERRPPRHVRAAGRHGGVVRLETRARQRHDRRAARRSVRAARLRHRAPAPRRRAREYRHRARAPVRVRAKDTATRLERSRPSPTSRSRTSSSRSCSGAAPAARATSSASTRARYCCSIPNATSSSRAPPSGSRKRSSRACASRSAAALPGASPPSAVRSSSPTSTTRTCSIRSCARRASSRCSACRSSCANVASACCTSARCCTTSATDDVELLQLVAERAALAIEKARVHEETVRLDQLKLNFVAIASHELRTPATSVYGDPHDVARARRRAAAGGARELEETAWRSDRPPAPADRAAARPLAARRAGDRGAAGADRARAGSPTLAPAATTSSSPSTRRSPSSPTRS